MLAALCGVGWIPAFAGMTMGVLAVGGLGDVYFDFDHFSDGGRPALFFVGGVIGVWRRVRRRSCLGREGLFGSGEFWLGVAVRNQGIESPSLAMNSMWPSSASRIIRACAINVAAGADAAKNIGTIRPPVIWAFSHNDCVFELHLYRSLSSACLIMLDHIHRSTSSPGFPGIVTLPGLVA